MLKTFVESQFDLQKPLNVKNGATTIPFSYSTVSKYKKSLN